MYTSFICSKSQPDDDPEGSKHVALWILHKLVFNCYLFILYFMVQHNGMHNFKIDTIRPTTMAWSCWKNARTNCDSYTWKGQKGQVDGETRLKKTELMVIKNKQAMARDRPNGERLYWKPRSTVDWSAGAVAWICSNLRSLIRCTQFLKKTNKSTWIYKCNFITIIMYIIICSKVSFRRY